MDWCPSFWWAATRAGGRVGWALGLTGPSMFLALVAAQALGAVPAALVGAAFALVWLHAALRPDGQAVHPEPVG